MKKVLYVNHGIAEACGVRDFGLRHADALRGSDLYELHYIEPSDAESYSRSYDEVQPDVVMFNYMELVLPWVNSREVLVRPAKRVVVQHLFEEATASAIMDSYGNRFNYMVCLDPTLRTSDRRIFPMHRPIPASPEMVELPLTHVSVGSFGFGLPHKQFPLIMREINASFDNAVFNLHMTVGHFTGDHTDGILAACRAEITKPGITLNHTSDYRPEAQIVEALSRNHINALFYSLDQTSAGQSSSLDYLIAAKRPILLTECPLFDHVDTGARYPQGSMKAIMADYDSALRSAELLYEEHSGMLRSDTERMLERIL